MPNVIGEILHKTISQGSPLVGSGNNGPSAGLDKQAQAQSGVLADIRKNSGQFAKGMSNQPRFWTKALKTMGIQMGIAGILKQSQIFTSTLGSLFQILGAFVDIMLAPWLPVIVPALRRLADQVPLMRIRAQKFFDWATGTAWPWISKIYNFIKNDLFNKDWWIDAVRGGVNKVWTAIKIWGLEQLSAIWEFLPGWMKGDTNPFEKQLNDIRDKGQGNIDATHDSDDKNEKSMGKIETALVSLAATWATAKTLRYGLQATRWVPFLKGVTEPIRKVSKGVDILFNRTAQAIGKGFVGLTKKFLEATGLKAKVPKVPKVTGGGGRGPGPRGSGLADDIPVARMSSTAKFAKGYDAIDWAESRRGPMARGNPANVTKTPTVNPKEAKAGKAFRAFQDWLKPAVGKMAKMASTGGKGLKTIVGHGMGLAKAMLMAAPGTAFVKTAARIAVRFLKLIPFLGASYMGAETTWDLKDIFQSEKAWTGDLTSAKAWMAEGAGHLAGMLGGGGGSWLNPVSKLAHLGGKALEHLPGEAGKFFKNTNAELDKWVQMKDEMGAISGGKAMDFGIRAITGYGGAAASFLPLIGQLAGGAVYEAGAYESMGQFMGMESTGTRRYGEKDMAGASIDALLQLFNGASINITMAGAPGEMQVGPGL